MSKKAIDSQSKAQSDEEYSRICKIDGRHRFKEAVPGSYVDYPARVRPGGKVAFFNFQLAKEMGLLSSQHPSELNPALQKSLLDTFALIIINEYDELHKTKIPKDQIKPYRYMATRYLQQQHASKTGLTSGDGRSIWNGETTYQGKTWDVSSCGTGATCLSPATSKFHRFFKSGDPSISYGCGYSEIDEGISTVFFSEVMHSNHVKTERVLAVIEFEKGFSITVRAHSNLLRPSHLFAPLKQNHYEHLKQVVDYYIQRQSDNGAWKNVPSEPAKKYQYFLAKMVENFAFVTAKFEDDYIFCWLDWDGDNVLMDGGIIDYGSIRQFGLFHHEYRYDDVEKFSTSIKEQRLKSRYTVQTFAQLVDYLITKHKKPIHDYSSHASLLEFDRQFEDRKDHNLAYKIGFNAEQVERLLAAHRSKISKFRKIFSHIERTKALRGPYKVADGITWDAIFCMRDILREYPQLLLNNYQHISNSDFISIIKSSYAKAKDLVINPYRAKKIHEFQDLYMDLVKTVAKDSGVAESKVLLEMTMRSSVINKFDRVTGDSVSCIIEKLLKHRPKLSPEEIYELLAKFVNYQNLDPEKSKYTGKLSPVQEALFKSFFKIVTECREGI